MGIPLTQAAGTGKGAWHSAWDRLGSESANQAGPAEVFRQKIGLQAAWSESDRLNIGFQAPWAASARLNIAFRAAWREVDA